MNLLKNYNKMDSNSRPLLTHNESSEEDSSDGGSSHNEDILTTPENDTYLVHSQSFRRKSQIPGASDNYFFVYIVFYLLGKFSLFLVILIEILLNRTSLLFAGMTTLLPWNFFITAEEVRIDFSFESNCKFSKVSYFET